MVVVLIEGVVKVVVAVPPVNTVPPDDSAYQSMVSPVAGVADINTVPVPQRELLPAAGATGNVFTVAVTVVLVVLSQPVAIFLARE
jgi:hypothetical protein